MSLRSGTVAHLRWNIAGAVLPAIASLAAIPFVIRMLGTERFGLLVFCWLLVAYLSLFDFGLTRALTKHAAELVASRQIDDLPSLFGSSMSLMWSFALIGSLIAAIASPYATRQWLSVPARLQDEALWAFWLTSASLPFLIATGGWRAILEALGRFDLSNKLQIPLTILSTSAPVAVLVVADSLIAVAALLLVIRILGWLVHRATVTSLVPGLIGAVPNHERWRRTLVTFGGWATASSIVGPLMLYADRLIIGGIISLTALSYYSTSYELVTRAWALSGAVIGVLFPLLSSLLDVDARSARNAYRQALIGVFVFVLAPLSALSLLGSEVLSLWLGDDFSRHSSGILQILAIGVLFNCVAQVSLTVVQAAGRTDQIAAVHIVEVGPYLLAVWWFADLFGVIGVAAAWTLRAAVDAIAMGWFANKIIPETGSRLAVYPVSITAVAMLILIGSQSESIHLRGLLAVILLLSCAVVARLVGREMEAHVTPDIGR